MWPGRHVPDEDAEETTQKLDLALERLKQSTERQSAARQRLNTEPPPALAGEHPPDAVQG